MIGQSDLVQSSKELGNILFKEGKYLQAIERYKEYVQEEHPDNKNAWFNMSLCYSKLRQPADSVRAAREALTID